MSTTTHTAYLFNCTVYDSAGGSNGGINPYAVAFFGDTASIVALAYNCVAMADTGNAFQTSTGSGGGTENTNLLTYNCAADDTSASTYAGGSNLDSQTNTDWFESASTGRLLLKGPASPGIEAGLNTGFISSDILGKFRPSFGDFFDIGAFEYYIRTLGISGAG